MAQHFTPTSRALGKDDTDQWWGVCKECLHPCERKVDHHTGTYDVTFWAGCPHKDVCEKRIMADGGFVIGAPT